jgi:hypothetical protein
MRDHFRTLKALAASWNEVWDFCGPLHERARKARENNRRMRRFIDNESGTTGVEYPANVTTVSGRRASVRLGGRAGRALTPRSIRRDLENGAAMAAFGESCRDSGHVFRSLFDPEQPSAVQWFCTAKIYSITSSARSKIDCGTVRPSDLAVLRFTAISNFVGS